MTMKKIDKSWQDRRYINALNVDKEQATILKNKAKQYAFTRAHLLRVIIQAYLDGKLDISEYQPDWSKEY